MDCDSSKAGASFGKFNEVDSIPNTNQNLPPISDHNNEVDDSLLMENNNNNGARKTEEASHSYQKISMHYSPMENNKNGAQITGEVAAFPLENSDAQKTGEAFNTHKTSAQPDLVSSPVKNNGDGFLANTNNNYLMQLPRAEGNDFSNAKAAIDGERTRAAPYYSPFTVDPPHSFSLALAAEKVPLTEGNRPVPSFCSEEEVNSFKPDQPRHHHIGSSRQAELLHSQRVGKAIVCDDNQFGFNTGHNQRNSSSHLFRPTENLNRESSQTNQQLPHWLTDINTDSCRQMAPSSSEVDAFKETTQGFNFMRPRSSELPRPSLLDQAAVPNMPNAFESLFQHPALTGHQYHFSHQPNVVATKPGGYNPQAGSSIYSPPLRTQMLPPFHQLNSPVPNLQHHSSMQQPSVSINIPREFNFHDLSDSTLNSSNLTTNLFGTQFSNSWLLQDPPMHSGSHPFPAHKQTSNHFSSMTPCLPNSDQHSVNYPELHENSFLSRLQLRGWLNQTARPVPPYPLSSSLLNRIFNSLNQQDNSGTLAPHNMETSLTSQNEQGIFGPRGVTRNRQEEGESSSFKRLRGESSMPQTSNADQVKKFSPPQNEPPNFDLANFVASSSSFSVYDPRYEMLGLSVDPHLRAFGAGRNR